MSRRTRLVLAGAWTLRDIRPADLLLAATCVLAGISPAQAADRHILDIQPGSLADVLIALGEQTGGTIAISDAGVRKIHSEGLRGRYSLKSALRHLLANSGYWFVLVDDETARIVRSPPEPRKARPQRRATREPLPAEPSEIVVTASKMRTPLDRYAGTVEIVDFDGDDHPRHAALGTEEVTARLPMMASTSLGPGRNKLFVRGIADSSFNGPTQATVGQYLGDARMTYNAPDPDLNLYDVERVELLEGPQGTLYGTGALGGILRIVPVAVDLMHSEGSLAAGGVITRHGADGGDLAGMANLPIVTNRVGVRLVGYGVVDPGYIDDVERGLVDVNRSVTHGGRATVRIAPDDGWTIDLGTVVQYISSRDGQYAEKGMLPLTRSSRLAQPFDNDYVLGQLVVRKRWDRLELVSASSIVSHDVDSIFDATGRGEQSGLALFSEDNAITLLSQETRLSGKVGASGSWVAGLSFIHDIQRIRRRLGSPDDPAPITGVRNEVTEAAAFGQADLPLGASWTATVGGRLTYADATGEPLDVDMPDATGEPLDVDMPEASEPNRTETHFSPTAAVAWRAGDAWSIFARYQQGFRAGGLAVSNADGAESVQRFEPDTLSAIELGTRWGRTERDRWWGTATLSYARWRHIQADLIDTSGLPFTGNIGDGRILGLEARLGWRPATGLEIEGGLFLNDSALDHPAPAFVSSDEAELPNIAKAGGRIAATWQGRLNDNIGLTLDAALRYVGASELGIAPPLEIAQGDFAEASTGARLDFGGYGLSLDISNLFDGRGNRFSFGNPFGVGEGRQVTPLRPQSIRLGIDAHF